MKRWHASRTWLQNTGSEIFFERRRDSACSIAATMQALAGKIERECRHVSMHMNIDTHMRAVDIDRRPFAVLGSELIDDGVLGFQGAELRVRDAGRLPGEVDGERARRTQMLGPIDATHTFIQFVGCACTGFPEP